MRQVTLLLRLEGLAVLAGAVGVYAMTGSSWLLFLLLLFVPDVSMLGYLGGNAVGALVYNLGHTYATPGLLLGAGWLAGVPMLVTVALIWIAHIGLDRMLGFGLKLRAGFRHTHLQGTG